MVANILKNLITLLFLCLNSIVFSQDIYQKSNTEKADSFLTRVFPQTGFSQIISGNWGDTTSKFKIIGFYFDTTEFSTKAIILQSMSNNRFQRLKFNYTFGIGVAPSMSQIVSVFFYDIDKNGTRELIVIESGTGRCHDELEEYNETTKKIEKISIVAACDICGYSIFDQKNKSLTVSNIDSNDEYPGNCDAKSVKKFLKPKK